uniref:Uncharacterized protein n=1 Tax=Lepeophtheirus salmonis TaxID=72036 RepID=A0A0K2UY75_LEPSM
MVHLVYMTTEFLRKYLNSEIKIDF